MGIQHSYISYMMIDSMWNEWKCTSASKSQSWRNYFFCALLTKASHIAQEPTREGTLDSVSSCMELWCMFLGREEIISHYTGFFGVAFVLVWFFVFILFIFEMWFHYVALPVHCNTLYRLGQPYTRTFGCLYLLRTGIKSLCCHTG